MVDAVFAWVDGHDPKHRAKRLAALGRIGPDAMTATAADATRFNDLGELEYGVRLLRTNAPFIENIFIVTDDQSPGWLTVSVADELGVQVVDHTTIFKGFEQYLPTFNSYSIESMISRIPGLAEQFIYLNDDFFMIAAVGEEDYFREGRPLIRGAWCLQGRVRQRAYREVLQRRGSWPDGLVGFRPNADPKRRSRRFQLAHAPYPLRRSWFDRYIESDEHLLAFMSYPFRGVDQPSVIPYLANRALHDKGALSGPRDWVYVSPWRGPEENLRKIRALEDGPSDATSLCIQSMDRFDDDILARCTGFLGDLL